MLLDQVLGLEIYATLPLVECPRKKSNEIYKMQETPSCSVFEETREQNCKLPEAKFKKGVKLGGYMIFKQYF